MPVGWSGSGTFTTSLLTDAPDASPGRTTLLGTIPPGSYGTGARLFLTFMARVGSPSSSFDLSFNAGFLYNVVCSGGPVTKTLSFIPTTAATDTFNFKQLHHESYAATYTPNGWSFDSGTTVSLVTKCTTAYQVPVTGVGPTITFTGGSPNVSGSLGQVDFVRDLVAGQWLWTPGAVNFAEIATIVDSNHLTLTTNANGQLTSFVLATDTDRVVWTAVLLSFTDPYNPPLSSPTFGNFYPALTPIAGPGSDTWTATSFSGDFGSLTSSGGLADAYFAADSEMTDAIAHILGVSTTGSGLFTPDLVNGNPNWTLVGSVGAGDKGIYSAMATWNKPDPYDTSMTWTGFPSTLRGSNAVFIYPASGPITSRPRSFGMVIG